MNNNRGFTLIELIVVLGLLGVVLTLVFMPIGFSFKSFEIQEERSTIVSNLRASMDYMTRQIRKADDIIISDSGNCVEIYVNQFPEEDVDEEEEGDEPEHVYDVYKVDGGNLVKNGEVVIEGIDELTAEFVDEFIPGEDGEDDGDDTTLKLTIAIWDSAGKKHELSSITSIR